MTITDCSGRTYPGMNEPGLQKLLDHFNRRDEDLHRTFCQFLDGDDAEKIRVLLDKFYEDLHDEVSTLLCNYSKAIDGRGRRHDMAKVSHLISIRMGEVYTKYLRKRYEPRLLRIIDQRQEGG